MTRLFCFCAYGWLATGLLAADLSQVENPLRLPVPGDYQLLILSPTILELTLISTKPPGSTSPNEWNYVDEHLQLHLPNTNELVVVVDGTRNTVIQLGFKRRVLYAPLRQRDLRIASELYVQLATPIADGQTVEIENLDGAVLPRACHFKATAAPDRYSPAIHVNQVGYLPEFPKEAMVGFFAGSLGEIHFPSDSNFSLVDAHSNREVYHGRLRSRPDRGGSFEAYQQVLQADFSDFKIPGEYKLSVPGLGTSFAFRIDEGTAAAFARTYALGLYHQRCGTSNEMPFSRFEHAPCHTAPADIPTIQFEAVQRFLAEETADFTNNPRHVAHQLKNVDASLYPFIRHGKIDVSGGHHDAGDYSKYTINSAALIHHLVFAADAFQGVVELDNLGLPESGDGKSDILQEAKWEADFLSKMQDDDGGFYFLVYPRDRRYEDNVLPDHGDSQVVWPKTTAATAAAVAALAQISSSVAFKEQFPQAAKLYFQKAKQGWAFLEQAIARHGKDGAYQKITHYGDDFMHDDELAWAACEMFLATGNPIYQKKLLSWFNPADQNTRKWTWWRLYGGYGCAIRSYAFGAKTHRVMPDQLDPLFLSQCEQEIVRCGEDQLHRAQDCSYGTSFPIESKRLRSAGWYFSMDQAFDLAVASLLDYPPRNDPRPRFIRAIFTNLNYEAGCNPVNVCFLTGLGWKRQREVVHQYALNDRRLLPPSGLPIGNLQSGFGWLELYQRELGMLSYPPDGAKDSPYPLYDRWGDSFNLQTEFVVTDMARGLATAAFLMANTPQRKQLWKPIPCTIKITRDDKESPKANAQQLAYLAEVKWPATELESAHIVWEAQDHEPILAARFAFTCPHGARMWIEAEVQWPDGRRAFCTTNFQSKSQ